MKAEKEALAGESTETPELPEPKEPVLPAEQKSNKAIGNYTSAWKKIHFYTSTCRNCSGFSDRVSAGYSELHRPVVQ